MSSRGLGDEIEQAIRLLGISPERIERWIGVPCGCEERKQKLNVLGAWAWRVVQGRTEKAITYLEQILGANNEST